ncbi:MAG: CYTH domain-containing protein [Candidatus Nomurabacteria bacterium]|jgi:predicted adenylyl cyclase CyaB|nr:CYTH domain-containing protein [Candidatus Nomurabacteria bacterium]
MKRVIVKAKLPNKSEFVSMLNDISMKFSAPFWQHDRIFVPKDFRRDKNLPRLSLRTIVKDPQKPATYALVLRRHIQTKGIDVVNFTTIKDYTEAAHIIHQLGFELKYEVGRERQELVMGEGVKVYLDKIDSLPGYYAKFESNITNDTEAEEARDDLTNTFEILKVNRHNIIDASFGEIIGPI